jgi:RNA polymerase sigma factor (sigma-70 family)
MTHEDPDFTEFVRSGCGEAFGQLVSRHVAAVHSGALRLLGGRADAAADAVQSVFIQLARHAASLPRDLVVSAWLHRQTVRTALNILRTERRRAAREKTAAELLHMNAHDSSTAGAALRPHIDRAIAQLPDIDQRALAMRYFDHCELREIAERLGMTAGAVQKRLSRAMERLRNILTRRGVRMSVAALGVWLSENAVQAAPPGLAATVATAALPHAGAGSGALSSIITLMSSFKSLTAGAALGLLTAGAWTAWLHSGTTGASAAAVSRAGENLEAVPAPGSDLLGSRGVPVAAATAEGLLDQLLSITSAPDNEITRQRFAIWMASIPEGLMDPLLALADKRLSETERKRWLPELARQWARLNPAGAIPLLAGKKEGNGLAAEAFRVWHDRAPYEARRWLVEHQEESRLAKALPEIVSVIAEGLAAVSEEAVVRWAQELEGNDLRAAALGPLWKAAAASGKPEDWTRLCDRLLNEEDTEFGTFALQRTLEKWVRRKTKGENTPSGLTEADQWLGSLPPGPSSRKVMEILLAESMKWAQGAPGEHTLAMLAAPGPQAAGEEIARLIAQSKEIDLYADKWLLPLLTGPERDDAVFRAARLVVPTAAPEGWSSVRPTHAVAIEWAMQLPDSNVRDPLVYGLYRQWLQYQVERQLSDFAGAWLERPGIPPDIKALMQRAKEDFQPKANR